jgi:hypothetical protein
MTQPPPTPPAFQPIPLFDEQYRWLLRSVLSTILEADALDDLSLLDNAYRILSRKVQEEVRGLDLASSLDAARVRAIAESEPVRATVGDAVLWLRSPR